LPVFPEAAFELQQLATDGTSIDHVAKLIGMDQALTLQVLKMANSALFSGSHKVSTIRDAVMRLGLDHVLNLVICTYQQGLYKSSNLKLRNYTYMAWIHALITAAGSRWLARELGYAEIRDKAFLSGLLHDIGKLVLIKALEAITSKNSKVTLSDEIIGKILATLHSEEGYMLMDEWSIPSAYCNIALEHHKQEFDTENHLLLIVRVVNHACKREGISASNGEQPLLSDLPEVKALDIDSDTLDKLDNFILEGVETEIRI